MSGMKSPDAYIDMGFFYMMSAALQRRVWTGSELKPLFPNIYIVLVGPPATGKGLVLTQISSILKHHKIPRQPVNIKQFGDNVDVEKILVAASQGNNQPEQPCLIPVAADTITFQALLKAMTSSQSRFIINGEGGSVKSYTYKSLAFCLEELQSLLKRQKETRHIIDFLLQAYDCSETYDYETKTQGMDRLRKICLSLLAGTTPDFLEEALDQSIMDQGLSSRVVFVYETVSRHNRYGIIDFSPEQKQARNDILDHIKVLSGLYGRIKFDKESTPDAFRVFANYFENVLPNNRINNNPKLGPYYARKDITATKLAMAIHFSKSTRMELDPQDCEDALAVLAELEPRMHNALNFGKNPLAAPTKRIESYIKSRGKPISEKELLIQFISEVRPLELQEILRYLLHVEKITQVIENGQVLGFVPVRVPSPTSPDSPGSA